MKFLQQVAQKVIECNAKSVALQFPDSMLAEAALFCGELEQLLAEEVLVYVLGDT